MGEPNSRLSLGNRQPILIRRMQYPPRSTNAPRSLKWPRFAALAAVVALVLAILWVRAEVRRVQEQSQTQMPAPAH